MPRRTVAAIGIYVPEIVNYELRRKLLHVGRHRHQGKKWTLEALAYPDDLVSLGSRHAIAHTLKQISWRHVP